MNSEVGPLFQQLFGQTEENHKHLGYDIRYSGQEPNLGCLKYETEALNPQSRHRQSFKRYDALGLLRP
jgi:hypothetical protein